MTFEVFHRLLDLVARVARVTRKAILGIGRTQPVVTARHVCAWLIRNLFGLSFPSTASALRQLDHTSAMNACRQMEKEIRRGEGHRFDLLLDVIGELAEAA